MVCYLLFGVYHLYRSPSIKPSDAEGIGGEEVDATTLISFFQILEKMIYSEGLKPSVSSCPYIVCENFDIICAYHF